MHKLLIILFTLVLMACDITQPVAPTPGDDDNEISSIITINIDTGTEPDKTANRAPVITSPGTQENEAGSNVVLQIMVFDPDGNPFACTMVGEPRGLTISSGCLITGQVSVSSPEDSPFTVIVEASDGLDTGRTVFQWVVSDGESQ